MRTEMFRDEAFFLIHLIYNLIYSCLYIKIMFMQYLYNHQWILLLDLNNDFEDLYC